PQQGDEIVVRIALMQEQRLLRIDCDLQLALEHRELHVARRIITVVVQPGFAHGTHFRMRRQFTKQGISDIVVIDCMVGMHARRGVKHAGVLLCERQRVRAAITRCAGNDQSRHAMRLRTLQHGIKVMVKRFMREIGADIEQLHGLEGE
ncbi:MAG TPA: hypothetical protein VGI78_12385, partial [Acetobacteraceae bacterium]